MWLLERDLELNGLKAPDEMPINTVTQEASQQNSEKPKRRCHHCKNQGHYQNQCRQLNSKEKTKHEIIRTVPTITLVVPKHTVTPTIIFRTIPKQTIQIIKETEDLDLSSHPVRPVVELTTPQRNVTLEQTQQADRLAGIDDRKDKTMSSREMLKAIQMGMSKLQPKL